MKISAEVAFALFAVLLGCRDVLAEILLLRNKPGAGTGLAFLICATIFVLSFLIVLVYGNFGELLRKIRPLGIWLRVVALGLCAAIVYLVTFEMIGRVGAGLFDLFDYG